MSSRPSAISTRSTLDDARLLGREELVPERIKLQERVAGPGLGGTVILIACRAPGGDDDLRAGVVRPFTMWSRVARVLISERARGGES